MVASKIAMITTMVEYKDRLAEAMKDAGIKTQALADHLGLSYQAVRKVLIGDSNAFTASNNNKAAAFLKVEAMWLSDGKGPKNVVDLHAPKEPPYPDGAIPVSMKNQRPIWVVGKGAGGLAERIWTDGDYPVGATEDYGEINSPDPQAFLVRVEGSSMWPKYEPGNYALVEPNTPVEVEDVVLVRLQTGETMIKRLVSQRNGYVFSSFNEQVRHEFPAEAVSWMYYVAHEVPRKRIKSRF